MGQTKTRQRPRTRSRREAETTPNKNILPFPGAPTWRGMGTGPRWLKFASEFLGCVRIRIRIRSCIAATAVHSVMQGTSHSAPQIPRQKAKGVQKFGQGRFWGGRAKIGLNLGEHCKVSLVLT